MEVPKVPVIQESVNRPSVVKVPLVKSENESIKESEKMEGKIPRFVPKGEQKQEKKSESEEVIGKNEAQTPGLAILMPHPQSQPPKPLTQNQILYDQWNQGGEQELISLTQGIWTP